MQDQLGVAEDGRRAAEKKAQGLEADLRREQGDGEALRRQLSDVLAGKGSAEDRATGLDREGQRLKEEVTALRPLANPNPNLYPNPNRARGTGDCPAPGRRRVGACQCVAGAAVEGERRAGA